MRKPDSDDESTDRLAGAFVYAGDICQRRSAGERAKETLAASSVCAGKRQRV